MCPKKGPQSCNRGRIAKDFPNLPAWICKTVGGATTRWAGASLRLQPHEFKYHDGNAQAQGFGHICFSVPDLAAAVSWFDANEVTYVQRPEQGKMRNAAFIRDRDGYWIEIVQANLLKQLGQP